MQQEITVHKLFTVVSSQNKTTLFATSVLMTLLGNRKTHEKLVDRTSSPTDILRREPIAPACVSYYARKTIEDAVCCLIHIWLEQKEAKGCMKKKNKVLKQNIEYLSLAQRGRESRSSLQYIIKCKYSLTNSFELNLDM